MADFSKGIFSLAYDIWNAFIAIAMTLFTTSPIHANNSVYAIVYKCFILLSDISIPIAIVFFLIAIVKDVIGTPPEQQLRRLLQDTAKLCVLIAILCNLWDVMGYIMQVADGITDKIGMKSDYKLEMSSVLEDSINWISNMQTTTKPYLGPGFTDRLCEWSDQFKNIVMFQITLLIGAIGTIIATIGASLTIINCAFQRIIKPLILIPFSTITLAMASGSNEAEQVSRSYIKTFLGLCLTGALMIISIKIGVVLINGGGIDLNSLMTFSESGSNAERFRQVLFIVIQNGITPIVIAGLVKGSESLMQRFL